MKRFYFVLFVVLISNLLFSQVPRTLEYKARLSDSDGDVINNPSQIIAFRIYNESTTGTPLWGETLYVPVIDGYLEVELGNVNDMAIPFDEPYWIELQIDSDGDSDIDPSDEILAPREKIAAVAFAHRAVYADTADNYEENQSLADVLAEGNDAEGTIITGLPSPTASSDAANKAYVDASEMTTGDGTDTYCIYIDDGNTCPAGWMELGSNIGPYFGATSNMRTKVCCQSAESNVDGYLVMSGSNHSGMFQGYNGSTSGLEGANLWCLDQMRTYNWNGKGDTDSLTENNVRAFLCDSDSCNNLAPNSSYQFATCSTPSYGGGAFITDGYGRGPRNADAWSGASYFGYDRSYWTNRGTTISYPTSRWGLEPYSTSATCADWSSTTGTAYIGRSTYTTQGRWFYTTDSCSDANYLICIVDK